MRSKRSKRVLQVVLSVVLLAAGVSVAGKVTQKRPAAPDPAVHLVLRDSEGLCTMDLAGSRHQQQTTMTYVAGGQVWSGRLPVGLDGAQQVDRAVRATGGQDPSRALIVRVTGHLDAATWDADLEISAPTPAQSCHLRTDHGTVAAATAAVDAEIAALRSGRADQVVSLLDPALRSDVDIKQLALHLQSSPTTAVTLRGSGHRSLGTEGRTYYVQPVTFQIGGATPHTFDSTMVEVLAGGRWYFEGNDAPAG